MTERRPTALILIAEGFHEIEAFVPYYRFLEIGWNVQMLCPQYYESIQGKFGMHFSNFQSVSNFPYKKADILIIPGGRSARFVVTRHQAEVQPLIHDFLSSGKPIGAIGQGALVLAYSKHPSIRNLTLTCEESIQQELTPLVERVVNQPCTVCNNIVTSRSNQDLPYFVKGLFHVLFERDKAFQAAALQASKTV